MDLIVVPVVCRIQASGRVFPMVTVDWQRELALLGEALLISVVSYRKRFKTLENVKK